MEKQENLTIVILDSINGTIKDTIFNDRSTLDTFLWNTIYLHHGISTGNQHGAGCTEYFFYVNPKLQESLNKELKSIIYEESLQEYIQFYFN